MSDRESQARRQTANDALISGLLAAGRLRVDFDAGQVFATKSNTPDKPIGSPTRKGYIRACINVEGRQVALMVHRIVWIAANGEPGLESPQINHKDTVKSNNRLANLELATTQQNMRHASDNGCLRGPRGERARRAKLTAADVLEIRRQASQGVNTRDLAARFGINRTNIRQIVRRTAWAWLGDEAALYVRGDQPLVPLPPEG